MATEAVLKWRMSKAVPFTVADGVAIPKGTLLKMTDNMTAIKTSGAGDAIAGIAAADKIASDGRTKLSVYVDGIFIMRSDGTFAAGNGLMSDGVDNKVIIATSAKDGAEVLGYALADATIGQDVLVRLNIGSGGAPNA